MGKSRYQTIIYWLILIVITTFYTNAQAWGYIGHMVISDVAYDQLSEATKIEVDRLLTLEYEAARKPKNAKATFARASIWADRIKYEGRREFNAWHYIDLPWGCHGRSKSPRRENVVWAIERFQQKLLSEEATDEEKAEALRFLLHFVGDIHQPLHAMNRCSTKYPRGDKGGNLYRIDSPNARNLHQLWDAGLGYLQEHKGYKKRQQYVARLHARYPKTQFKKQLADHDVSHWAIESHQLARQYAYGVAEQTTPHRRYRQKSKPIVEQQLTLAGYRLAQILNQIYDSN